MAFKKASTKRAVKDRIDSLIPEKLGLSSDLSPEFQQQIVNEAKENLNEQVSQTTTMSSVDEFKVQEKAQKVPIVETVKKKVDDCKTKSCKDKLKGDKKQ